MAAATALQTFDEAQEDDVRIIKRCPDSGKIDLGAYVHHTYVQHGRVRKPTVHIRMGRLSVSRKALLLGFSLILLQIADGLLTYSGLNIFGVQMEGNTMLREMMHRSGSVAWVLFLTKMFAIAMIAWLTFQATTRRWLRPVLGFLSGIFFSVAVLPWCFFILHGA